MDLEPEDVAKFSAALDKWMRTIESSKDTPHNSIGNATIVVQTGGFFALILFFVVSVTLGITIAMSLSVYSRMSKIETKQDEQSQYLNAIYMMAPQLKQKESKHE